MKRVIGLIALMGLTACGNASFQAVKYTCSIDGPQIVCPDGTSADLPEDGNDGVDGVNGIDGQDGTQVKIIDPCGDGPGVDEVVMVFGDGTVLAWYLNVGFSVLQEGVRYQTTDSQKCQFSVVAGEVIDAN